MRLCKMVRFFFLFVCVFARFCCFFFRFCAFFPAKTACRKCKFAHKRAKMCTKLGHAPSTAGTFRKKFRKNSGKTQETLSERFLEFPSRVRLGYPKPCNSRHLRLPEHFQNSLPPSTAGDASFFRSGSGEGLSEPVTEFPAVLGVFLKSALMQYPLLVIPPFSRVTEPQTSFGAKFSL